MRNRIINSAAQKIGRHTPEIFTGIGIVGMMATVVLAVRATPKAMTLLEEKRLKREDQIKNTVLPDKPQDYLTLPETISAAWKPYIPAAITGTLSIVCLISSCSVSTRRNAALAAAANMSATALRDFREAAVETVGERKVKDMDGKVAEKRMNENPASQAVVYAGPGGKALFFDELSNQYFESDRETIRKVVNDLNWQMGYGSETYVSLSQFYDALGLSHTPFSDIVGWNIKDGNIELNMTTKFADDGRPCGVVGFMILPTYDYQTTY